MKISASWKQPIELERCKRSETGIYKLDLQKLPESPGVYVFGRTYGDSVVPIYIGETLSLRSRIKGHLNSIALMDAIKKATKQPGNRFLIYCTVHTRSKDLAKSYVKIIETALIRHSQGEGYGLVNVRGTKRPTHQIDFTGNMTSQALAPRSMLIERVLAKAKRMKKASSD
jgi:hypothetical protein